MIVLSGFLDHIGRLVHPDVQTSELDRAQHRAFLMTRFGLFLAVVAAGLVSLAFGVVPGIWEAMAMIWLTLPFVAAIEVSRTGRLREGEAMCLVAWWGLAVTVTLAGGTSLVGGCALLIVVPLEASFSGRPRQLHAAAVAALSGAVALGVAAALGAVRPAGRLAPADAALLLPALAYVVVLARVSLSLQRRRQRLAAIGEERYRVLSEAIGDLVLRYDRTGGVVMASREAETLFGIKPRDLLGRGLFERVLVADRPAFLTLFADAAATGDNVSGRVRLRTARTTVHERGFEEPIFAWIEIRARRFDPAPGAAEPTARTHPEAGPPIVAIVRDITAQMEHEQAIEVAKQEAERHNQWKDTFLANVSHELRTPLNAIIGFSEMLASRELSPRDPEKQREYSRIITTSGQHLLSVVNSLLDISKIEAGCFEINPEPFALRAMIQSCCDMVGLKAEQGGIAIACDIDASLGEIVGDKRACKQIMINLLSNALKFTPAGGAVSVTARPDGETVLIGVVDSGIGIATRDLERLGNAFFQAKSGLDRPYEGTGLGLSVVRGLVGLHGGSIAIASAQGEGTTVTLRLPLDCRGATPVPSAKIETISLFGRGPAPVQDTPLAKVPNVA